MHPDFIDRYSRNNSPIHRMPAGVKCSAALLLVACILVSPWTLTGASPALFVLLVGTALGAGIPPGFLFRRILGAGFILALLSVLILLQPGGVEKFFTILIKSILSLTTAVLLANTTPFSEVISLLKRIRLPAVLVTVLALMYRYIFVLFDEMGRMKRARESRSFGIGHARRWHLLGTVLARLFIRSTDRAERIYAAMCARGWDA